VQEVAEEIEIRQARERLLQYRAAKSERAATSALSSTRALFTPEDMLSLLHRDDDGVFATSALSTEPLNTVSDAPAVVPVYSAWSAEVLVQHLEQHAGTASSIPGAGSADE